MKLVLNLSIFLFTLITLGDKSLSLTDYQIKKVCKKEKRHLTCIKILKEKRSNLNKGNFIEIPVKPYRKNSNFKF